MSMLETLILVAHLLVAIGICGFVLLQHGKGADMGARIWQRSVGKRLWRRGLGEFPVAHNGCPRRAVLPHEPRPHLVRDDAQRAAGRDAAGDRRKDRSQGIGRAGTALRTGRCAGRGAGGIEVGGGTEMTAVSCQWSALSNPVPVRGAVADG